MTSGQIDFQHAEFHILFIIMLSVISLDVIILNVIMPSVVAPLFLVLALVLVPFSFKSVLQVLNNKF
jgi:hypothetical protein